MQPAMATLMAAAVPKVARLSQMGLHVPLVMQLPSQLVRSAHVTVAPAKS